MGSPNSEPERRPGEEQVKVSITHGFWCAKFETTQAAWKRIVGKLPGAFTRELPEEDDLSWCRDFFHLKLQGGLDPDLYSAQATAAVNSDGSLSLSRRGGSWGDPGWANRAAFIELAAPVAHASNLATVYARP